MEDKKISFQWETGHIDIMLSSVMDMSPAELKKIVKTATKNYDDVTATISAFLSYAIDQEESKSEYCKDKRYIARLKKLFAVVEGRKETAEEKAAQKILKSLPDSRVQYNGIFEDAGKFCIIDGYRMIRFAHDIPSINRASGHFDTAKAIGDVSAYSVALDLPTAKEIKDTVKLLKSGACRGVLDYGKFHAVKVGKHVNVNYDFGYRLPMLDAEYLLDMLTAFPNAKAYAIPDSIVKPVYFVSGDNDGIILPVRKHAEYEDAPTVPETVPENVSTSDAMPETVHDDITETTETAAATADTTETAVETVQSTAEAATEAETETPQDTSADDGGSTENVFADVTEILVVHPLVIACLSAIKSDSDCLVNDSEAYTGDSVAGCINSHAERNTVHSARSETAVARSAIVTAFSSPAIVHPKTYTPPGPSGLSAKLYHSGFT